MTIASIATNAITQKIIDSMVFGREYNGRALYRLTGLESAAALRHGKAIGDRLAKTGLLTRRYRPGGYVMYSLANGAKA